MTTFAASLAQLGATGRAIAALAAPILDPVDAFLDRQPAASAPVAPIVNITINLVTAPEEPQWPIN